MAQPTSEASTHGVNSSTEIDTLSEQSACPICGFTAEHDDEIYKHLQTSHRKSALAGLVLDLR